MIVSLFNYATELHLTSPSYNGLLENITMFNDKIVFHKNVDNPLHIKISDRDRVRYKVSEEIEFQLRLRIIDRQNVVVSSTYLVPEIEGHFFSTVVTKEALDDLRADEMYTFIITKVENDVETPLYLDHDFNTQGELEVRGNYLDTYHEVHTHTEPYPTFKYGQATTKSAKHVFSVIIKRDETLYGISITNVEGTETNCTVTLEKNGQGHYPFSERSEQWDEVLSIPHKGESVIPFTTIPERVYMRVVLHTDKPEDFQLNVEKVAR